MTAASMQPALRPESIQSPASDEVVVAALVGAQPVAAGARQRRARTGPTGRRWRGGTARRARAATDRRTGAAEQVPPEVAAARALRARGEAPRRDAGTRPRRRAPARALGAGYSDVAAGRGFDGREHVAEVRDRRRSVAPWPRSTSSSCDIDAYVWNAPGIPAHGRRRPRASRATPRRRCSQSCIVWVATVPRCSRHRCATQASAGSRSARRRCSGACRRGSRARRTSKSSPRAERDASPRRASRDQSDSKSSGAVSSRAVEQLVARRGRPARQPADADERVVRADRVGERAPARRGRPRRCGRHRRSARADRPGGRIGTRTPRRASAS